MSVILSLLNLVPGRMGGSETYVRQLLQELAKARLDATTLVSPAAAGFTTGLPERVTHLFPTGESDQERTRALLVGLARHRSLARLLEGAEVVHYPLTVPIPRAAAGQRSVVTLLDVQHHDLRHLFSRSERLYRSVAYDRAARRADAILTISEFCKRQIVHHLEVQPERVHVAPLGVRLEEHCSRTPVTGPPARYLLYPARAWAHKNHEVLFTAFRMLRRMQPDLELVLTGARAGELPALPSGVSARGIVSRGELLRLYGSAAVMVFPSLYEGFGLPVLEAMASGCPVAAARSGALPEVVGDAGVLFDPTDPQALVDGVLEAMDRTEHLVAAGLARAALYDWGRCASVHLEVYGRLGA